MMLHGEWSCRRTAKAGKLNTSSNPCVTFQPLINFAEVLDWARGNLDKPLSLDMLAERARMSRRTFTRRFRQAMGNTVGEWLLSQRLSLSQQLLETTDSSIELIAERAGFGSTASLRQHFNQTFKISPSNYRREFRGV